MGRPLKWTDEIIEKIASEFDEWSKKRDSLFIKHFAHEQDFPSDYLHIWAKKNDVFSRAYTRAKERLEGRIFVGALKNELNPAMAKFALNCNYGWREKTEIVDSQGKNPLDELLKQINGTSRSLVG